MNVAQSVVVVVVLVIASGQQDTQRLSLRHFGNRCTNCLWQLQVATFCCCLLLNEERSQDCYDFPSPPPLHHRSVHLFHKYLPDLFHSLHLWLVNKTWIKRASERVNPFPFISNFHAVFRLFLSLSLSMCVCGIYRDISIRLFSQVAPNFDYK